MLEYITPSFVKSKKILTAQGGVPVAGPKILKHAAINRPLQFEVSMVSKAGPYATRSCMGALQNPGHPPNYLDRDEFCPLRPIESDGDDLCINAKAEGAWFLVLVELCSDVLLACD